MTLNLGGNQGKGGVQASAARLRRPHKEAGQTERRAQPGSGRGCRPLGTPQLRMWLLDRRPRTATARCTGGWTCSRSWVSAAPSAAPSAPPAATKMARSGDAGRPMSHSGGGPPELLPGQVRPGRPGWGVGQKRPPTGARATRGWGLGRGRGAGGLGAGGAGTAAAAAAASGPLRAG